MLTGRTVAVAGRPSSFVAALADELRVEGATVVAFGDGGQPIDGVVHVPFDHDTLVAAALAETDDSLWDARCESVLRESLSVFRGAFARLHERGGTIVIVTPTASLMGAAGMAPATAAAEGVRSLMKSAARQWGSERITANCVAVPVDVLAPARSVPLGTAALADPVVAGAVGSVVAMLLSRIGARITGATIAVDGGVVMLP